MNPETSVCNTIKINATVTDVWDAITNVDQIKKWMQEADLKLPDGWVVGSAIIYTTHVNGKHESKGTILHFEPEKRLQYTSWTKISRLPDVPEN